MPAPSVNYSPSGSSSTKVDATTRALPRKKQSALISASRASIAPAARSDALRLDDIVYYSGGYEWVGRVVAIWPQYVLLLDWKGRMARPTRHTGIVEVVTRRGLVPGTWQGDVTALATVYATSELLARAGAREAIRLASHAEPDPADFDRWMLPIDTLAADAPLKPPARTYFGWPAVTRRCFEAAVSLMNGERQREVLLENVMGPRTTRDIMQSHGLCISAVRMARLRARGFLRATIPQATF